MKHIKGMALVVSVAVGAAVWIPLNAINTALDRPPNEAWSLWYWSGYPLILALVFGIGYRLGTSSWLYGPIAVFASYVSALFLVVHTGNLLPFELLWMGALSIPAVLAERMGAKLGAEKDKK